MPMPSFAAPEPMSTAPSAPPSSGARLVTSEGRALPLQRTHLRSRAGGGLARSVLSQRFHNDGREALEVTYLLPLPSDGAVSGYSFTLAGEVTRGTVVPSALARERYEEALMAGRSASLLEQERSNVFRQAIGNVPPGQSIDLEVIVDHPLAWLGNGWELRFPTVVAPRYQEGAERSPTVPVELDADQASRAVHEVELAIDDVLVGDPASPSHALQAQPGETTHITISGAELDRDCVVRWPVATPVVGARLETATTRGSRQFGLLTLVPPGQRPRALARDLIVLLDTSGSMDGEPLAQAVRVVSALVQSLGEDDSLELIEFGSKPRRFQAAAVPVNNQTKAAALAWLASLRACGGTEMRSGIDAALAGLRPGAQRQVILVSDGLIGFERQVLQQLLRRLPASCRFHSVGVGHATNASLLGPAARAGRGACVIIAPGEDVEPACQRLLARTAQPLVVNLQVSGSALAEPVLRPLDLYESSPVLVPLALNAQGGVLEIRGETPDGAFLQRTQVEPRPPGSGDARITTLYARNRVEDLELAFAAGEGDPSALDAQIERLGVDFQIASRLTSWVAVSDTVTVDGTRATRQMEQPQRLPAGMSAEGLGLRSNLLAAVAGGVVAGGRARAPMMGAGMAPLMARAPMPPAPASPSPRAPLLRQRLPSDLPVAGAATRPAAFSLRSPRELTGKIRINNERRLVVSFKLVDEGVWQLPERLTLWLADGRSLELQVDAEHSTQSGTVETGLEVRLVCHLDGKLASPPERLESPTFCVRLQA